VVVSDIEISAQDENSAIINFKQVYDSANYSDKVLKQITFRRIGSTWKISDERVISAL
jgi:translation initiation factor 2 beta subunit (eIF-2beta)/eIF-5